MKQIKGNKYARLCTCCGKGMNEGYFANYEYFCSDSCLHTEFSAQEWEELYNSEDTGDSEYYWTEWEDTEDYQYQMINGVLEEIN